MVDHSCILTAVHQKKLEVTHVGNVETELPISSLVLEATVSPIPDLGLGCRTLELSAHRVVNTMGLSPPSLHVKKEKDRLTKRGKWTLCGVYVVYPETADSVREEAVEALGNLLGLDSHCGYVFCGC